MSRIAEAFAACRSRGELALVPYLTGGYPDPAETVDLLEVVVDAGADVIELGVPFSDPVGDGPVIQRANQVSQAAGTTTAGVLDQVAQLRARGVCTPVALMGYFNPFLRYGAKAFVADAVAAGVDGLIIPDLPPTGGSLVADWRTEVAAAHLDMVGFVAPDSQPTRLEQAGAMTGGFLYCLAANGVTGARDELDPGLIDYLARVRRATDAPTAVGFGIARPDQVAALRGHTDGAIVGSALIRTIDAAPAPGPAGRRAAVHRFVSEMKAAGRWVP
ncbi:MAG: hypothetical protein JWM47_34 [Acidimicrobiales bacterium]|nr:hypothetical protein [Acidimicrobiales bacterium]